jgi:hypothetical protein
MIGSFRSMAASHAVTTETPQWRRSWRGRIPGSPRDFSCRTVTHCSDRKGSPSWIMSWLLCSPADHGMIRLIVLTSLAPPCSTLTVRSWRLRANRQKLSRDLKYVDLCRPGFESRRPSQQVHVFTRLCGSAQNAREPAAHVRPVALSRYHKIGDADPDFGGCLREPISVSRFSASRRRRG